MIVGPEALRQLERGHLHGAPMDLAPSGDAAPANLSISGDAALALGVKPLRKALVFERLSATVTSARKAALFEYERGIAALFVPVLAGGGAIAYFVWPGEPSWMPILLWLAVVSVSALSIRNSPIVRTALMCALLCVAGFALAKFEVYRAGTKVLGSEISTRLTGYVADIDFLASGRVRLVVDIVETERPKLRYQPGRVRVFAARLPADIVAGSLITGIVKLHPPSGPVRPGGYDFSFESYFDGIGGNGYFISALRLVPEEASPPALRHFRAGLDNFRNAIAARIRAAISGAEGEIAAALIVGVRAGIPEPVNESLRRTGLAHILSISGLHMALVAGIVMGSLRLLLAFSTTLVFHYSSKKLAAAGALAVASIYLFISGADIAAQRSYLMVAIMLIAVLMDRQAISMRNLAIAALIVLVASPHEIVGPSFQMSFAATAALIGAYRWWAVSRKSGDHSFVPRAEQSLLRKLARMALYAILGTMVTALVAGIASSIYGVWHFQRVSSLSLFANLAVSPIVSLVIMPFGIIASIAMPFGIEGPALFIMGKGVGAMLAISDWLSVHSPVDAVGLVPLPAVVWLTIALVFACATTTRLGFVAIPCAFIGFFYLFAASTPDILVSEDANLVALRRADGALLVSQERPSGFVLNNWIYATAANRVEFPQRAIIGTEMAAEAKGKVRQARSDDDIVEALLSGVSDQQMLCAGGTCIVAHETGAIVTIAEEGGFPDAFCAVSDLIIVKALVKDGKCGAAMSKVIDLRALAKHGSAQVELTEADGTTDIRIDYAIAEPYRPWHANRVFSRAARGIPAYVPPPKPSRKPRQSNVDRDPSRRR